MQGPLETEMCYVLRRLPTAPRMAAILSRCAPEVSGPRRRELEDQFLDTADLRLARAGAALRLRLGDGDGAELTLKSLAPLSGALAQRMEISEPLRHPPQRLGPNAPGPSTTRRIRPVLQGQPLRLCFRIRQTRDVYTVRTRQGAVLLVSLDTVRLAGEKARTVLMLEAELHEGPPGELIRFSRRLCSVLALRPARQSKYDLGLAAAGLRRPAPADPTPPRPSAPIAAILAFAVRKHAARLEWHEAGVRLALDPEAVHDMRVACRRLRTALRVFGPKVAPVHARRLHDHLARLARRLGVVRDLDVHEAALAGEAARLPAAEQRALAGYLVRQREERRRAHAKLLTALAAPGFPRLVRELESFAERAAPTTGGPAVPAPRAVAPLIRRQLKRLRRLGRTVPAGAPDRDLHRLRIRCKKLRYTCEFLQDSGRPSFAAFASRLAQLQDALGRHQDRIVEAALVDRRLTAIDGKGRADERQALEALRRRLVADRLRTRHECAEAWKRFDRREARQALLAALK